MFVLAMRGQHEFTREQQAGDARYLSRGRRWFAAMVIASGWLGCAGASNENLGSSSLAITTNEETLGFEVTQAWSKTAGTLALSDRHVEGQRSLSISNVGYTELTSRAVSSLGTVGTSVSFDLLLPTAQPNPSWLGAVDLYISLPSAGIFNRSLGHKELTGLPLDSFQRVQFELPADVRASLGGAYSDLTFKLVLNVPTGNGQYLFDRLSLGQQTSGGGGGGGAAGTGSSGGAGVAGSAGGGAAPVPTETLEVKVVLPLGRDPGRVGLGVTSDVYVADRAKLVSSNRTWVPLTTNVGSARTEIGVESSVGTIISYDDVFLHNRCTVNGDVIARGDVTRQSDSVIAGQVIEDQVPPPGTVDTASFGWRVALSAPSTAPVIVEPGTTRALTAGSYGAVNVKSSALLDLSGSKRFRFKSLMVEPGASIRVADDLPSEIYIDETATFRGAITTPTAATPPPITMVMAGTGQMSFESKIRALMIAPRGKVVLGGIDRDFFGAIFAQEAELRSDVTLHHIGVNLPPLGPGGPSTPVDLPDVPNPYASAGAHCGPRDKLSFSAWPMPGFCPAQLSLSPFNGTRTGELRWVSFLSAVPLFQPIVGDGGDFYVVSESNQLFALSAQGHVRWSVALAAAPAAPPTVLRGGAVIVPLANGSVASFSRTGQSNWTASSVCSGAPTAVNVDADGNLLVACSEGKVALRSAATGTASWSVSTNGAVHQLATVGNPGVVLIATDSELARLNRADGAKIWSRALSAAPSGSAALLRDVAYVATTDGSLLAIKTDGSDVWQASLGGTPSGNLAISPWGTVLVPLTSGEITSFDVSSGAARGRYATGSEPVAQLLVGADGLIYARAGSRALGLAPAGQVLWTYTLSAAARGITLNDEGLVLAASAGRQVVALGSNPNWTMGGGATGSGSGDSGGFNPAACEAQKLATGNATCDPGGTGWGDPGRVSNGDGNGGSGGGGNPTTNVGQSLCLPTTPPSGVTSQGLGGLAYRASQTNGVATGELVFNPPASVPAGCELKFCQEEADGSETPLDLPFSRVAQNPNELPTPTSCASISAGANCPVDPASKTDRACSKDAECNAGEICAVFCDDSTCQTYETRCGLRMACESGGLSAEPAGPFNQDDPSTWPCEELRECAETGAAFGASGDAELKKTGSLELRRAPRSGFNEVHSLLVPAEYPSYASTLAADPCGTSPLATTDNSQLDSRSGSSGNQKWGLFVEPDLSQSYKVELGEIMALPNIDVQASGSFRAGARVWGKEIEIINARAEAKLATCTAHLLPSLVVLGNELQSWAAYASGDFPPAPEPPTEQDSLDCQNAINSVNDKLADLKKSLLDARTAWDAFRRNGQVSPASLCERTRAVLGNVDPGGGCTAASARAWLDRYESLVHDAQSFIANEYGSALRQVASKTEGAIAFAPDMGGPIADIGASTSYPIGPIVLTLEIEVAGDLDVSGRLSYGMGLDKLASGEGGPNVRVEAAPGAHVDAFVFVGVGLPGVSVGVEGELRLIGVSAPLHATIALSRNTYSDPRSFSSSGIFGFVNDGPGLLTRGALQKWNAGWGYGAGVVLETLSGKINLAARIRLLFFKKTFRKKIAEWKGLTTKYEFVGKLEQPLAGSAQSELVKSDVPYPDGDGNLEAAFNATPVGPAYPVNTLGSTSSPGACGCVALGATCTANIDCCNSDLYKCVTQTSGAKVCAVPPTPPTTTPGPAEPPRPVVK